MNGDGFPQATNRLGVILVTLTKYCIKMEKCPSLIFGSYGGSTQYLTSNKDEKCLMSIWKLIEVSLAEASWGQKSDIELEDIANGINFKKKGT